MCTRNVDVVKSVKLFSWQIFAATAGTLFAISDGMSYGWTSPMIPYLISSESHISTTEYEAGWLETAMLCGCLAGLPLTIYSVDKFGRKRSIILASVATLLGWALIALGDKMVYLFLGRFFCGLGGDMAFIACPMYVAEISDQKIRGFLSGMIYIMVHIGTLLVYTVGYYAPYYGTPLLASTFIIIQLLMFHFIPESPYYLMYTNKLEEARRALEYLKPKGSIDEEIIRITQMLEKESSNRGNFQDLFLVKSNRKAITIMAVLNSGQHLCAYTAILMNLHLILESTGSIYMESSEASIIFAGIMLLATIFSSSQVDKYGRRILLITSSISSGLCVLTLAVYFHFKYLGFNMASVSWIPIASVMVYACVFKIGVGIVPIIVTAEIFPTNLKALGMSAADAMYIVSCILAIQIYQILSRAVNKFLPFYFFGLYAFFVAFYTFWFIPETKGRSLDEIQSILKGESSLPDQRTKKIAIKY